MMTVLTKPTPLIASVGALVGALVLLYSVVHFAKSGIQFPLAEPNLGQIEEEVAPLRTHLGDGKPVDTNNPRQYGPVFFFVMDPLLRTWGNDPQRLAQWLFALQMICLPLSFVVTWATVRPFLGSAPTWLAAGGLAVLWLNFAPVFMILAIKSVETWELLLISATIYFFLRGWRIATGVTLATAALIKLMPIALLFYFAFRDRRVVAYTAGGLVALLLVGQVFYGSQMGVQYLPKVMRDANGWALTWHENISLKAWIAKKFGELIPEDRPRNSPVAHVYDSISGASGYVVELTKEQMTIAKRLGLIAQVLGLAWLTWAMVRVPASAANPNRIVWDWSFLMAMALIFSPMTGFEYCTLTLGAFSYAYVRLLANSVQRPPIAAWACFAGAVLLVANIAPRPVINRLFFIEQWNQWTGYTHLTASEGYQYYGFPLFGLILLALTLWQLRDRPDRPAQRPVTI